jgi:hypothetical protein
MAEHRSNAARVAQPRDIVFEVSPTGQDAAPQLAAGPSGYAPLRDVSAIGQNQRDM